MCFSGGWECPSAAARALPGRGGALWGCFSERAAAGRWAGPAGGRDAAREPAQKAAAGVFFSRGRRGARQGRCGRPRGAAVRSTRLGRLCGH